MYKFARKIIKKRKIESVLDIGCRDARKTMKLFYPLINELYGINNERYFIDICKKRYGLITFYYDNIENSNLELNKKFDLIISSDVIEHLLTPDNLIAYSLHRFLISFN